MLRNDLAMSTNELNQCKGDQARLAQRVARESDEKIERERAESVVKLAQSQAVFDLQTQDASTRLASMSVDADRLRQAYADQVAKADALTAELQRKADDYGDRVADLVRRLTGTATAKGQLGEHFVKNVHCGLQLGAYESDTHNKNAGFADGTWSYKPRDAPKICALVEVKYKQELHTKHDIEKFEAVDIPAAVNQNRINMGIFISLCCRRHGKPMLSLESVAGVPVLWVSRAEDDHVPAERLVSLAFCTMAEIWPMLSQKVGNSLDNTLPRVARHLDEQSVELDRLCKSISSIEKNALNITRTAQELHRTKDKLLANIQSIRLQDTRLSLSQDPHELNFWESPTASLAMERVHEYYTAHRGRYPRTLEELELDERVAQEFAAVPNAFQDAKERVKARVAKRKREPQVQ